jgi:hypothetical protein
MKVRIKSFEDMPPYSKCCEETIEAMKSYCGQEVEVDETKIMYATDICNRCGTLTKSNAPGYSFIQYFPHVLFFDYMEIDEGVLLNEHTEQNSRNDS